MKKLIIITLILILTSITSFAELSEGTKVLVEELRIKHYGISTSTLFYTGDSSITWKPIVIELIDFEINGMKFKGWEILVNDKPYYVVLLEKGECKNEK